MNNPFVTKGYAGPDYFCDRVKETEDLVKLLTNENNMALISPRRIGKTDLIHHCFAQPSIQKHYYTFIIDIYATNSLADFVEVFGRVIFDTLKPFTKYAAPELGAKGAFVLLCTSNPGMVDIEHQELKSGGLLLEKVGNEIARTNEELKETYKAIYGEQTCGAIGAVVGATQEKDARWIRDKYPQTFFLIPGYGAQGGAAAICKTLLEKAGGAVNSSRGILCAWKKDEDLAAKIEAGTLCLADIADSAAKASLLSKEDLTK